ncbi:helix-turn-helix domain-containing protein [Thermorudis peleae]|uniref:helix-turn-helix domain-containing protein n=1 Tax=Thermorudis peleae TaxID=1382356 RepID=UPI00056EE4C4|nr:helix-turn-helix transcriptional regulator [Thermorudis peleae]
MNEERIWPLRRWRIERGYGIRELARRAGVSHATITAIEHGRRQLPRGETWRKLAEALAIKVTQIAEYRAAVGLDADAASQS